MGIAGSVEIDRRLQPDDSHQPMRLLAHVVDEEFAASHLVNFGGDGLSESYVVEKPLFWAVLLADHNLRLDIVGLDRGKRPV